MGEFSFIPKKNICQLGGSCEDSWVQEEESIEILLLKKKIDF